MNSRTASPLPAAVPFIIGNEIAERFSYYGMRSILMVYMVSSNLFTEADAVLTFHLFSMGIYLCPVPGAILADALLGKYPTIILLSLVYCLGHATLALDLNRTGIFLGLSLIAIGSGGIKPCVSAHLGDQFDERSVSLLEMVFSWFYLGINLGAFIATLLIPYLLEKYSPHVAFGVPGVLMAIATLVFWSGRTKYIAVPPIGIKNYLKVWKTPEGVFALKTLTLFFLQISVFWSLFDQSASTWVLQAEHMDLTVPLPWSGGITVLPSQIQSLNPLFILILVPLFSRVIYPIWEHRFPISMPGKIYAGMLLTTISFGVCSMVEFLIQSGAKPSIYWHVFAYVLLTAAEVLVSVTALEFSYTQAPPALKSSLMSFYLLSVALGNAITVALNYLFAVFHLPTAGSGITYYLTFTGLMLITSIVFRLTTRNYIPRRYMRPA